LTPSKYVAYYETNKSGNKNPKTVTYLAKNKIFWNRITLSDAKQINELQYLFQNKELLKEISTWYKDEETFHIALTEEPTILNNPLILRQTNRARILSRRKCQLTTFLSAKILDDIFKEEL
jgi:hypothetical protein